jgi:hypothetical protein
MRKQAILIGGSKEGKVGVSAIAVTFNLGVVLPQSQHEIHLNHDTKPTSVCVCICN